MLIKMLKSSFSFRLMFLLYDIFEKKLKEILKTIYKHMQMLYSRERQQYFLSFPFITQNV